MLGVVYVGLRLLLAASHHAGINPDSADYLNGLTLRSRPPVVPFVYTLLGNNTSRIAMVQGVVGGLSWLALAAAASRSVSSRAAQSVLVVVVLLIGLTDVVCRWDSAMLTESFAISFGVLFLASVLWTRERPSPLWMIGMAALWAFTREANAIYLVGIGVMWLVLAPRLGTSRRVAGVVTVSAVIAFALTWGSAPGDASMHNVTGARVLLHPDMTTFFQDRGMPVSVLRMRGQYSNHHDPTDAFRTAPDLADYRDWAHKNGRITYLAYMLFHPVWAVAEPLKSVEAWSGPLQYPPPKVYGSPGYQSLVPTAVQRLLFPDRIPVVLAELAIVGALVAVGWSRSRRRPPIGLPVTIVGLGIAQMLLAWHADTIETGRHALIGVIQLRLGLALLIATALDASTFRRSGEVPTT